MRMNNVENNIVNNMSNGFNAKKLSSFGKRYPVDLGEGRIVFLDTPMTVDEYREVERKQMQERIEAGRVRREAKVWNQAAESLKPVRKPLFDRTRCMNAKQVLATDKLSQMIAAAMQEVK